MAHSAPIYVLDDDSLLNVFHLYRPALLDGDEDVNDSIILGKKWHRERWWYKLAHVCRGWRYLILGSASHLGLHLLFTHDTPVADMLAHSPPLPLIIDHFDHGIWAHDRHGIMLALLHRDRVRRIRLTGHIPFIEWLIVAIDYEFPMLEYLCITLKDNAALKLPRTFQAPRLRHLVLANLAPSIESPLLSGATGLVTLSLQYVHPSAYFRPNELLQRVSLLPHLETLRVEFHPSVSHRALEHELSHMPNTIYVTLPNLRSFGFGGFSSYLEAFLSQITAPRFEALHIAFFDQQAFSISSLLQFMATSKNLRLRRALLLFDGEGVKLWVYPPETPESIAFALRVYSRHPISAAAQIFNAFRPVISSVADLTLEYEGHRSPTGWRNEATRIEWRALLRSFNNVEALHIANGLIGELSHSLLSNGGESPIDFLPELKRLSYSASSNRDNAFTEFIDARKNTGCPVTLVHHLEHTTLSSW